MKMQTVLFEWYYFQKIQDSVHVDEEFWLVALVLQKCTVPFIKHFFPFLSFTLVALLSTACILKSA